MHFRTCFTAICNFFDLNRLELVPYSLRRGGATFFYTQTSSLDSVMIRGRWKDQSTARIYLGDARATLVRMAIPPGSKQLVSLFRQVFLSFVSRSASEQG